MLVCCVCVRVSVSVCVYVCVRVRVRVRVRARACMRVDVQSMICRGKSRSKCVAWTVHLTSEQSRVAPH